MKRKSRWDTPTRTIAAPPQQQEAKAAQVSAPKSSKAALHASVKARLAALKKRKQQNASNAASNEPSKQEQLAGTLTSTQPALKKAKHFDLNFDVTGPSYTKVVDTIKTVASAKTAKKVVQNPYLAHLEEQPDSKQDDSPPPEDASLHRTQKARKSHKQFSFVQPGTFVQLAERKRQKALNALESGFLSGRKASNYYQPSVGTDAGSKEESSTPLVLPPRADQQSIDVGTNSNSSTTMPFVLEWWDMEYLPPKMKKQLAQEESKRWMQSNKTLSHDHDEKEEDQEENTNETAWSQLSLSHSKTFTLVQHLVPVRTAASIAAESARKPTLHLTKKELRRQRKLRRAEQQRRIQDEQAVGLRPPPEPRCTLSNFMQVLGQQAVLDPSRVEQRVMEQVTARQRAHEERNRQAKLTPEQRAEKLRRKYAEDTKRTQVAVALFYVRDLQHRYHRTKVDLNAQQNSITGMVLECLPPDVDQGNGTLNPYQNNSGTAPSNITAVICEGGPKAIERYIRFMTVRMKWNTVPPLGGEEEEEDTSYLKDNTCSLVWKGWSPKRFFKGFVFTPVETSHQARKLLTHKGVGQYWDQVVLAASGGMGGGTDGGMEINLKLVEDEEEGDDDNDDKMDVEIGRRG